MENLNLYEVSKGYKLLIVFESIAKLESVFLSCGSELNRYKNQDDVNKLFVENNSQDTIILLAGEVVKGGKQDRTLATDLILPPGKGKKDIDVFCVEYRL